MSESDYSLFQEERRKDSFSLRNLLFVAAAGLSTGVLLTVFMIMLFSSGSTSTSISRHSPSPPTSTSPSPITTSPSTSLITTSQSSVPSSCARVNKKFTVVYDEEKTWFEAIVDCDSRNMSLASPENEDEYQEVIRLLKAMPTMRLGEGRFWVSGTDLGHNGRYMWMSSGREVTLQKWYSEPSYSEPNNRNNCHGKQAEHCIELLDYHNYRMNDYCCENSQHYICERTVCLD